MTLCVTRLSPVLGVEVSGVDLRKPLSADVTSELRRAWLDATVLLIRNQALTPDDLLRFTRSLGKPFVYTRAENALPGYPEVLVLSNLMENGRPIGAPASGRYWHTDGHFLPEPPAASLLYSKEAPATGGDTHFANMAAAYADLPETLRQQIDGRRVVISRVQARPYHYPNKPPVTDAERAAWPDTPQPMVRTHPETGRNALYIGGDVPWRIEGMPEEESAPLLAELQSFSKQPRFVYTHRWRAGDLIVWDNRSSIHCATAYDEAGSRRLMYRTTIQGDRPFFRPSPVSARTSVA
jgi:taurine dioxygenase/putative 2-oxoglutarate oxygenase